MFQNLQVSSELPDIEDIDFKSIEKSYLKILVIIWGLTALVLSIVYLFLFSLKYDEIGNGLIYVGVGIGLVLLLILLYLVLSFKKRKYAIRTKDISYQSGLIFHAMTTVPFSRIQHIEIGEGPVERLFKMASLNIFTAGDNGRDLRVKGLKKTDALSIKAFITSEINE